MFREAMDNLTRCVQKENKKETKSEDKAKRHRNKSHISSIRQQKPSAKNTTENWGGQWATTTLSWSIVWLAIQIISTQNRASFARDADIHGLFSTQQRKVPCAVHVRIQRVHGIGWATKPLRIILPVRSASSDD